MNLRDFMVPDAFVPQLKGTSRDEVINELIHALAHAGCLDEKLIPDVSAKIIEREQQGSTGIGKGIAVPHIKHPGVDTIVGTVGCSQTGVDFASLDKAPVYSVLLLISPPDNPDQHLEAMETLFAHLQRDMFRKFLRQADNEKAISDLLKEADESSPQGSSL